MLLQIENTKIKANLTELNAVVNPIHGDAFFITSEDCVYSYYNTTKNEDAGQWKDDCDFVMYHKTSILSEGFTDVTASYPDVLGTDKEEVKLIYQKYETDGIEFNNDFRAGLVLKYKGGLLTALEIYYIEAKLDTLRKQVKNGDWLTASNTLSQLIVEGSYTQDIHDEIETFINNYIANNY